MSDWMQGLLAEYATARWARFDPDVLHEASRRVIDTLAVGVAALHEDGPVAARDYARSVQTKQGATIWGESTKASPETAALVNGVAMRYHDYSDSYFGQDSTHPSDIIPGALAICEVTGATGAQLLESVAVGYEVCVVVADSFGIRRFGWDHTNVTAIGACCAFARLLGLSVEQLRQALAITVVPHAAMLQTCFGALTMWKGYGAPDAMRQALYACLLSRAGVKGPPDPFTGARGLFHLMLHDVHPPKAAFATLEGMHSPTRILDTHIKAWPVGYVGQSAVEAALRLRERSADRSGIASVEIETFRVAIDLMGSDDKWCPETRESADHSIPFIVAKALMDGKVDASSFDMEKVRDPAMHDFLRRRVRLTEDENASAEYPAAFPARVTVSFESGAKATEEVTHPRGHAKNPLSDAELVRKFTVLTEPRLGKARTRELLGMLQNLAVLQNFDDLGSQLAISAL